MGDPGQPGMDGMDGQDGTPGDQIAQLVRAVAGHAGSVVRIGCSGVDPVSGEMISWTGSGSVTSQGILTARHVTQGSVRCTIFQSGVVVGSSEPVTAQTPVVVAGVVQDVAIMTGVTWSRSLPALVTNPTWEPQIGDVVGCVSHPLDISSDPQLTTGLVTDTQVTGLQGSDWAGVFMTDYAAAGGSSGAPVFNLLGEVVGVHVGGYNTGGLELNYSSRL